MRIAFQVFATIFLISLMLGAMIMVAIDFDKAREIEAVNGNIFGQLVMSLAATNLPSPTSLRIAGFMWLFLVPASIVGIVANWLKRHKFGWIMGAILGALLLLVIIVQPSLELSNGNDPKFTGFGVAFFGMLGIGLLVLVHTALKPQPPISNNAA